MNNQHLQNPGILARVLEWLFGYDYFIAHRSSDGKPYANALYDALTREGNELDCFLDVKHYGAGGELSRMQSRALRKTTRILVVVTPDAHSPDSRHMASEIEEFRKLHPGGKVVPIGCTATLTEEGHPGSKLHGLIPRFPEAICVVEDEDLLLSGKPSSKVVSKLLNDFEEERTSTTRLRWIKRTVLVLLFLTIAIAWLAILAEKRRGETVEMASRAFYREGLGHVEANRGPEALASFLRSWELQPDYFPAQAALYLAVTRNQWVTPRPSGEVNATGNRYGEGISYSISRDESRNWTSVDLIARHGEVQLDPDSLGKNILSFKITKSGEKRGFALPGAVRAASVAANGLWCIVMLDDASFWRLSFKDKSDRPDKLEFESLGTEKEALLDASQVELMVTPNGRHFRITWFMDQEGVGSFSRSSLFELPADSPGMKEPAFVKKLPNKISGGKWVHLGWIQDGEVELILDFSYSVYSSGYSLDGGGLRQLRYADGFVELQSLDFGENPQSLSIVANHKLRRAAVRSDAGYVWDIPFDGPSESETEGASGIEDATDANDSAITNESEISKRTVPLATAILKGGVVDDIRIVGNDRRSFTLILYPGGNSSTGIEFLQVSRSAVRSGENLEVLSFELPRKLSASAVDPGCEVELKWKWVEDGNMVMGEDRARSGSLLDFGPKWVKVDSRDIDLTGIVGGTGRNWVKAAGFLDGDDRIIWVAAGDKKYDDSVRFHYLDRESGLPITTVSEFPNPSEPGVLAPHPCSSEPVGREVIKSVAKVVDSLAGGRVNDSGEWVDEVGGKTLVSELSAVGLPLAWRKVVETWESSQVK